MVKREFSLLGAVNTCSDNVTLIQIRNNEGNLERGCCAHGRKLRRFDNTAKLREMVLEIYDPTGRVRHQ